MHALKSGCVNKKT